jgi:hypothetical protein
MSKHNLTAAGYAVLLPLSSTVLVVLFAVGVDGAVSRVRRLARR